VILMTRQENGVDMAIQCLYRDMEYAKSLIKRKDGNSVDDAFEESEESWTFIGDENDPEVVKAREALDQSGSFATKKSIGSEMSSLRN
jgi:sterol 3beta-glucosyltransferase